MDGLAARQLGGGEGRKRAISRGDRVRVGGCLLGLCATNTKLRHGHDHDHDAELFVVVVSRTPLAGNRQRGVRVWGASVGDAARNELPYRGMSDYVSDA